MSTPPSNPGPGDKPRGLLHFVWQNKLWWMIPILVIIALLVGFGLLTQTARIPTVYSTF